MKHYMSKSARNGWLKLVLGLAFCTTWRLVPFRPPNVQPILATMMPLARYQGPVAAGLFGVANMILFDVLTGHLSVWTAITSVTYGVVGVGAWSFLRNRRGVLWYAAFAVVATLFYDAITGVVAGSVLFGLPWMEGLAGQIPFTINHLIGNVILALALSPLVDLAIRWRMVPIPMPQEAAPHL